MTGESRQIDVLCVGHAAFDLTFAVPHHPSADEKMAAESLVLSGGGPAGNAAVAAARLGCRAAFAGYLGNDIFGEKYVEEFKREGVCLDLLVRGEAPTPLSVVFAKAHGTRSVVNFSAKTRKLAAGEIDLAACRPEVILFDGHEPLLSPPLALKARERGIPTVLDAGSVHQGTRELCRMVDYLIASEKFALDYTAADSVEGAVKSLADLAPYVIVTLGARGLFWKNPQGRGKMPAFAVEVVDSTGAGDAFHGAFATGLARGKQWEDLLRFSSAAAAVCCTRLGARSGLPGLQELQGFLSSATSRNSSITTSGSGAE